MLEFLSENLTNVAVVLLAISNLITMSQMRTLRSQVEFLKFTTIRGESDENQNRHEEGA